MAKFLTLDDASKKKKEGVTIQQSAGAGDADKIISTDANGQIDPSFLPNAEVWVRTASEALSSGDFVNIFDDAGTAKARKADASDFSTRANGFVRDNYALNDPATIYAEGIIGGFVGLTIGEPVFLSDTTPGDITQTPPADTDEVWQQLGVAISATEVRVEIGEAICRA